MSVAESEAERVCRDSEVRRLPHRPTVTNQDRLRCFVPHAEPIRHFVGHLAVTLDGNHFVGRASTVTVEMRAELIESLGTDAARAAVFEQQNRTLARLCDRSLEHIEVGQGRYS